MNKQEKELLDLAKKLLEENPEMTIGEFRKKAGIPPSSEWDWNTKKCPKCGGKMDVYRGLVTGHISFYNCRTCNYKERLVSV